MDIFNITYQNDCANQKDFITTDTRLYEPFLS